MVGLVGVAAGAYSLLLILDCTPAAHDCVGWALLGAAMFLVPGILIAGAGAISYSLRNVRFVAVQGTLVGVLAVYFVLGFAFP